jgi:hypothetical protein
VGGEEISHLLLILEKDVLTFMIYVIYHIYSVKLIRSYRYQQMIMLTDIGTSILTNITLGT